MSHPPFPTLTGAGAARLIASPWRIVVAGAGGWMGRAALEALHELLDDSFADRVLAFGSDRRLSSQFRDGDDACEFATRCREPVCETASPHCIISTLFES